MNEVYLTLAEAFRKIADEYLALANDDKTKTTKSEKSKKQKSQKSDKPKASIEDVRAVLAQKSQEGKTKEVKSLLMKYDAEKLSLVKPKDYETLIKEAEVL